MSWLAFYANELRLRASSSAKVPGHIAKRFLSGFIAIELILRTMHLANGNPLGDKAKLFPAWVINPVDHRPELASVRVDLLLACTAMDYRGHRALDYLRTYAADSKCAMGIVRLGRGYIMQEEGPVISRYSRLFHWYLRKERDPIRQQQFLDSFSIPFQRDWESWGRGEDFDLYVLNSSSAL